MVKGAQAKRNLCWKKGLAQNSSREGKQDVDYEMSFKIAEPASLLNQLLCLRVFSQPNGFENWKCVKKDWGKISMKKARSRIPKEGKIPRLNANCYSTEMFL